MFKNKTNPIRNAEKTNSYFGFGETYNMKILILTHARSGGLSLMRWIEYEKSFKSFHEPNLKDSQILNQIYDNDNIVVKILPGDNGKFEKEFDYLKFISHFDVVIIHKRINTRESAISLIKSGEENEWHKPYTIDNEWLENNEIKIQNEIFQLEMIHKNLDVYKTNETLITTYESIYNDKTDIDKLCFILKIKEAIWLDILDSRHRLQNGQLGMERYKAKEGKSKLI